MRNFRLIARPLSLCIAVLGNGFSVLPALTTEQSGTLYVAHVGTVTTRNDAIDLLIQLRKLTKQKAQEYSFLDEHTPHIHELNRNQESNTYPIQLGPPMEKHEAETLCAELKAYGHGDCDVVNPFQLTGHVEGFFGDHALRQRDRADVFATTTEFGFVDEQARIWSVPANTTTDCASIPAIFWPLVGSPCAGKYLKAAIIHDYYCQSKERSWSDTHDIFYQAMLANGVPKTKALLMWAAVQRFGPRWTRAESGCWGTCAGGDFIAHDVSIKPNYVEEEFKKIQSFVEDNPGADQGDVMAIIDSTYFKNEEESEFYGAKITGVVSGEFYHADSGNTENTRTFVTDLQVSEHHWTLLGTGQPDRSYYRAGGAVWHNLDLVEVLTVSDVEVNDVLNIRDGPGSKYNKRGEIPPDGAYFVLSDPGCKTEWCEVTYEGVTGWISTSYTRVIKFVPKHLVEKEIINLREENR